MSERYIPKVTEASIPEDGGWAEVENEDVLVLSIPEWKEIADLSIKSFQYVWMYDRQENAYILCMKLNEKVEKAIAFAKEHAGLLLTHQNAYQPFSILITPEALDQSNEQTPYLYLPKIELKRHPKAGW